MGSKLKQSDFPVSFFVFKAFDWIKFLSIMNILSFHKYFSFFKSRSELTQEEVKDPELCKRRGRAIEIYLLIWVIIEIICSIISCTLNFQVFLRTFITIIIGLRIIEIIQVTVNATIFDAINNRPDNIVASKVRMVILSLINFLELIICFGIIYALYFDLLSSQASISKFDSFYFSTVTQLTIGYGDISPTSFLKFVASLQGLLGLLFVVLILARFITALPKIESLIDDQKEETN